MAEGVDKRGGIDRQIDQRLLRMAAEPVRLRALIVLNERAAGVSELAGELGISVGDTAHHIDQMHDDGLVEVVGEVLGPQAIEPSYRATVRVIWSEEEWAELSLAERRRVSAWVMRMINSSVCEALETGTFDMRLDAHMSRRVSFVDEQGWEELRRIHDQALEDVYAAEVASAERLARSGEEGVPILSARICCELPPRYASPPS